MNYISFYIAYKFLRSKKSSRFTSIISKSSIIGISLGIAAIIVVMSIMNGFHSEMRDKILSMVSHVIVTEKNYTLKRSLRYQACFRKACNFFLRFLQSLL